MPTTVSSRPAALARPVTKRDLDREIARLLEEVAADCAGEGVRREQGDLRPRWIRPVDLVRRVLPFTSRN